MQKWCIADFPEESDKGEIESSYSEFCQREENKPGGRDLDTQSCGQANHWG